jgi:tetratricopeptide (TPR) repeat protein
MNSSDSGHSLRRALPWLFGALLVFAGSAQPEDAQAEDAPALATPTVDAALAHARAGSIAKAISTAKGVIKADPSHAEAGRLLQDLLRRAGRIDEARAVAAAAAPGPVREGLTARLGSGKAAAKQLEAVLKKDGAPARFRLDVASAYLEAGAPSTAESWAALFLSDHDGDAEGLTLLGSALAARGKAMSAGEAFEKALASVPGYAPAAAALAALHGAAGRASRSRKVLQDAIAIHANHPTLLAALAEDHVRAMELTDAVRVLTVLLTHPIALADVHAQLSEVHRALGALPASEASAKAALALDKSSPRALRSLAFVKQKRKQYADALKDYQAVALLRPKWAQIHVDVAFVLMLTDELKEAEAALKLAVKLDKRLLDAHLKMGMLLYLQGKGKAAKKSLGVVLKKKASDPSANRHMGYVLLDEGKPKKAIKHFQLVADQDEKDSSSVRMIGRCHLAMGKVDAAVASFEQAVSRNTKDGFAHFDLGKGLEKQEKWEEAIAAYEKSIAVDAKLAYPHLYLAELYDEVQGEPELALPHYKRYLELNGRDENDTVKKRIEQLEKP